MELKNNPLVVDGTSYLPLREIAGQLGYELSYDDTTRTISFEQKQVDSNQYQELTKAPDCTRDLKGNSLCWFIKIISLSINLISKNWGFQLRMNGYR